MKVYNKTDALDELIVLLKKKQAIELQSLKDQFHYTYESLKPVNLIKKTFHDVASSAEIREELITNAIGLASGYLTKKVIVGTSENPFRKILGLFLQFAIATFVTKHSETIKAAGDNILEYITDYVNGISADPETDTAE
jgi:hypothetical protein